MPEFKKDKSGFRMKGWSAFTKIDPTKKKNKSNANQTDERVFDVNQEKYDKWNRLKNLGKGPDVRYLGAKENKSHLDKYTKWKKEDGKFIADDGTPMKKKTDPPVKPPKPPKQKNKKPKTGFESAEGKGGLKLSAEINKKMFKEKLKEKEEFYSNPENWGNYDEVD
jgi:hypothetical protein